MSALTRWLRRVSPAPTTRAARLRVERLEGRLVMNGDPIFESVSMPSTLSEGEGPYGLFLASDPDGDALMYATTGLPTGITLDGSGSGGVLGGSAGYGVLSGGTATFTPTLTVSDGNGGSVSHTWTLTVSDFNRLSDPGDQETAEGDPVWLQVQATEYWGGPATGGTFGAAGLPFGLIIDPVMGVISGTPGYATSTAEEDATFDVVITYTDGNGALDAREFEWTITNEPLLSGPADRTNAEGETVSESFAATVTGVTYAAIGLPGGLSLDSATGLVTGVVGYANATPTAVGTFTVVITASQGGPAFESHTVEWTVTDTNRLEEVPDQFDYVGAEVLVDCEATDNAGNSLTFSATGLPAGLSIDPVTGEISGTVLEPATSDPSDVTVSVTGGGATDSRSFEWYVIRVGSLSGRIWLDDGDGVQESEEVGQEGTVMLVEAGSGLPTATAQTDTAGGYSFADVAVGSYLVGFATTEENGGFSLQHVGSDAEVDSDADSTGVTGAVTVSSGQETAHIDAGVLAAPVPGSVSGRMWSDDGDGIQQSNELGLSGLVQLWNGSTGAVLSTTTVTDGSYSFATVPPATYSMQFQSYAGPDDGFSPSNVGSDDTVDSDADSAGYITSLIVGAGATLTHLDAGVKPVPVAPTIDLKVDGLPDAGEENLPGKKIHINDNFDEGQQTATSIIPDYLPDPTVGHQIVLTDSDLVKGEIAITSSANPWFLNWTISPKVKVWFKEWTGWNAGEWVAATGTTSFSGEFGAIPAKIELRLEGVGIGTGTVKVEFAENGGGPYISDTVAFTVSSGLKLTGALAATATTQLADATGWTLDRAGDGSVWRTGGTRVVPGWKTSARNHVNPILASTKVTSIGAVNRANVQIGSFDTEEIDPSDIAVFGAADARLGAGALVHELVEQSQRQVHGVLAYLTAHNTALAAEGEIVAGGGTRTQELVRVFSPTRRQLLMRYQGGIRVVLTFDTSAAVNISDVTIRRP